MNKLVCGLSRDPGYLKPRLIIIVCLYILQQSAYAAVPISTHEMTIHTSEPVYERGQDTSVNKYDDKNLSSNATTTLPIENITDFIELFETIKNNYAYALNDKELFENAKIGLAGQLDAYSRYLDDSHYQQLLHFTEGRLGQPALKLSWNEDAQQWTVAQVGSNTVAFQLGMRIGDKIDRIDGINIQRVDERGLNSLLLGSLGSIVSMRVNSNGHIKTLDIIRDQAINYEVEHRLLSKGLLWIRIKAFQDNTVAQVRRAILEAEKSGHLSAILLDIRDNPGGVLATAVDLADVFLEQGLIVSTKSRILPPQQFRALPSQYPIHYPVAILQNRFSASAAEVFAAALKEQNRAVILGENSYGKGAIQKIFPLKSGAVQLTVAYYYTPQGHLIENQGITPTVPLHFGKELSDEQIIQLAATTFEQSLSSTVPHIEPLKRAYIPKLGRPIPGIKTGLQNSP